MKKKNRLVREDHSTNGERQVQFQQTQPYQACIFSRLKSYLPLLTKHDVVLDESCSPNNMMQPKTQPYHCDGYQKEYQSILMLVPQHKFCYNAYEGHKKTSSTCKSNYFFKKQIHLFFVVDGGCFFEK